MSGFSDKFYKEIISELSSLELLSQENTIRYVGHELVGKGGEAEAEGEGEDCEAGESEEAGRMNGALTCQH